MEKDRIDVILEKVADVNGSRSVFRELGRLNIFCARMKFSTPKDPSVGDHPMLPVYPWCRSSGRSPAVTVTEAAELYLKWTEELAPMWCSLHPHLEVVGG